MAKAKSSKKDLQAWKKKKWFKLHEKNVFDKELGETLVLSEEEIKGKFIKVNASQLTGSMGHQNIQIGFYVNEVKDRTGYAMPISYMVNAASIKRMVRRGKDRIDHSFAAKTKDDVKVRVKLMIITRSNTTKSVLSTLRKMAVVYLTEQVQKFDYGTLFRIIIDNSLAYKLQEELGKIYPVKSVMIRTFKQEKLKEVPITIDKKSVDELRSTVKRPVRRRSSTRTPRSPRESGDRSSNRRR